MDKHFILIIFFFSLLCTAQNKEKNEVQILIDNSRNQKISIAERIAAINKAYILLSKSKYQDSIRSKQLQSISKSYFNLNDTINFKKTYREGLDFAFKVKDSMSAANHYWNIAFYYRRNDIKDSAFYFYDRAKNIFQHIDPEHQDIGKLLLNMARIQKELKDYSGSQFMLTNAIKLFELHNDSKRLYSCYNNLGIISMNLEDYEKSLEYHNKALEYLQKIKENDRLKTYTLNNIGLVYRDQGKYKDAIDNFEQALSFDSLHIKNPKHYATLLDNLAYSKFLSNDTLKLPNLFYKSLKIRESLNYKSGIAISKLHLAEYYHKKRDTVLSQKYISQARTAAIESSNMKQLLLSLLASSKIDSDNGTAYLETYIHLDDSLLRQERTQLNKFARIQFETDQYITQNQRLSLQNTWIVAISTAIIFFGFLIYVITQQRTRNKELEMEQQQQRANEEIYNLMIDQQDKIEEGRKREKERISLELHDGILGRLFGTRISLGSLNAKDDVNSKKVREQYINELQSIEEEVRNISHELGLDNFDKTTSYSTMITNLLEEQSKITNFKYQIEEDDRIVWTDIPGHIKINIYRIIQESIQNINKYAQAENTILDFKKNDDRIILTIKDDGVGFDQDKRSSGIGLKNMKSRVTLLHGQFTINSIPGKGTSISVDVPLT
ncbi:sensor histidine kinase [Kordia sp.]|uniref:ATP-binding protein n=1 Tax=Kordia sp. TaxID=1965332 RepID=UPI0025C1FCA4|nr:sensor histidine kinase [Kordia sp.]MCH2195605.1 sensor histidine kinase [Kordia sp.]